MVRELPEAARGRGRSEQRLSLDPNRIFLFIMYQGLKGDNGAVDRAVGLVAGVTCPFLSPSRSLKSRVFEDAAHPPPLGPHCEGLGE